MSTQQGHETQPSSNPENTDWATHMRTISSETVAPPAAFQYDRIAEENRLLKEKDATRKKRNRAIAYVVGGVLVGGGAAWGVSEVISNDGDPKPTPPATAPVTARSENTPNTQPSNTMDASEMPTDDFSPEPTYPEEMQGFLEWIPAERYENPISAFKAWQYYEENNPGTITAIDEPWFQEYTYPETRSGEVSDILYDSLHIPDAASADLFDEDYFLSILAQYTPQLDALMNQLAKNPGTERRAAILNEFANFCMPEDKEPDEFINDFVDFVDQHGGASSNFRIMPPIKGSDGPTLERNTTDTVITQTIQRDSVSDLGLQVASTDVSFYVEIETFNQDGESTLTYERMPTTRVHLTKVEMPSVSTTTETSLLIG